MAIESQEPTAKQKAATEPSWLAVFLAALPHLLIGLLSVYEQLTRLPFMENISASMVRGIYTGLLVLAGGCALFALIYAWRSHWPRWWASWIFYLLLILVGLITLIIGHGFSEEWQSIVTFGMLTIGETILMAWLLYHLACRDMRMSLMAALPAFILIWMSMQEFVDPRVLVWLNVFSFGSLALSAALILVVTRVRLAIVIALVEAFVYGMANAWVGIFLGAQSSSPMPSITEVIELFFPPFMISATLLLGALLGETFRRVGQASGKNGSGSYRLALLSLLLIFLCLGAIQELGFVSMWSESHYQALDVMAGVLLLAVLGYTAGASVLGVSYLRHNPQESWLKPVCLGLAGLLLPCGLILSMLTILHQQLMTAWGAAIWSFRDLPRPFWVIACLVWLAITLLVLLVLLPPTEDKVLEEQGSAQISEELS